jgi:hypothetical protein
MWKEYDKAWAKYQEGLKIKSLPLLSWGQFSSASIERNAFESIQKNWKNKENVHEILTMLQREVIITNCIRNRRGIPNERLPPQRTYR